MKLIHEVGNILRVMYFPGEFPRKQRNSCGKIFVGLNISTLEH